MKCSHCREDFETWTYTDYTLLQLLPPKGEYVIFAMEDGTLDVSKADMLAMAKVVTTQRYGHRSLGGCGHYKEKVIEESNDIVAMQLFEGWFHICNECSNFAGLCAEDQDPYDCLGALSRTSNKEFYKHYDKRPNSE